jgi:hypothetical protein
VSRQHRGLRGPDGVDLTKIPTIDCSAESWHRAVAAHHPQPWRFSSRSDDGEDAGRFDLDGERGTCYFAATPVGAILERVADPEADEQPLISTDALRKMRVWSGAMPLTGALADVTVASVPELSAEISTTEDYEFPWAWADAFDEQGRSGIRYHGRFAMRPCAAVFGEKGLREVGEQPAMLTPKSATAYELDLPDAWREAITRTPTAAESEQAPSPPDDDPTSRLRPS